MATARRKKAEDDHQAPKLAEHEDENEISFSLSAERESRNTGRLREEVQEDDVQARYVHGSGISTSTTDEINKCKLKQRMNIPTCSQSTATATITLMTTMARLIGLLGAAAPPNKQIDDSRCTASSSS